MLFSYYKKGLSKYVFVLKKIVHYPIGITSKIQIHHSVKPLIRYHQGMISLLFDSTAKTNTVFVFASAMW